MRNELVLARRHEWLRKQATVLSDKQTTFGGVPRRTIVYWNDGKRTTVHMDTGDVVNIKG